MTTATRWPEWRLSAVKDVKVASEEVVNAQAAKEDVAVAIW